MSVPAGTNTLVTNTHLCVCVCMCAGVLSACCKEEAPRQISALDDVVADVLSALHTHTAVTSVLGRHSSLTSNIFARGNTARVCVCSVMVYIPS